MFTRRLPRRRFLQAMLATGALRHAPAWGQGAPSTDLGWLLLGSQNGAAVYRARWNAHTGQMGTPELAVRTPRPTYLALNPQLPVLYAGNEEDGAAAAVSAFTLDRRGAALTPLATQPTHGSTPCFVSCNAEGDLLFAANYGGGSLSAFALDSQGKPSPAVSTFSCADSKLCGAHGPVPGRQDGPHLHCAVVSPDDRFVLACDLGDDAILVFPLHPHRAPALSPPQRIAARPGSGPRHLAFHPNGHWLYCIHELDCTVELFHWETAGAAVKVTPKVGSVVQLAPADPLHPAPPGKIPNTAAEIRISPDGRFLYTCTRGADTLSTFSIDAKTGALTRIQEIPCGGQTPRFFALDPTGHWLLCTNQDSGTVTVFARDSHTGLLAPRGGTVAPSPMCVVWL